MSQWTAIIWGGSIAAMLMLSACMLPASGEVKTGEFGRDYWFVQVDSQERIETFDGWNFTVMPVRNYTLDGIILSKQFYSLENSSIHPIDTFSPLDVFIGVEDIAENPQEYPFTIEGWEHRAIYWIDATDKIYFRSHVGNNHLIPHNAQSYQCMMALETGDRINITGSLVDLEGINGNQTYQWETGTRIGDYECEIILVDNITVNGYEWGIGEEKADDNQARYIGIGISAFGLMASGAIILHFRKEN